MAATPQPVHRTGPVVAAPIPVPPAGGPGAPPAKPVQHAPGALGCTGLPAASPAGPQARAGPGGTAAETRTRHDHCDAAKGKQQRGRARTGPHELRVGGLDRGLQAPHPGHHGTSAVPTYAPHGTGVYGGGCHHGTRGGMAGASAAPRCLPVYATPPTSRNAHTEGAPHGGTAVRCCGGAAGGRRGKLCPPPRPGADCGQHRRAVAGCALPVARHAPRAHPRQGGRRRNTPLPAPARGSAGATGGGLPGHPTRPRRGLPVAHPNRRPVDGLARHRQARGLPAPC